MADVRVIEGGREPAHEVAGAAAERVRGLLYEMLSGLPLATSVGVLEIVKMELIREHD